MKKIKLFSLPALAVVIGLYSCSKGDTGATGAKGPAGPDSVYHSVWIAIDLVGQVSDGDSLYQQDVPAPNLTQAILDSGMIVSYIDYVFANPNGPGTISDVEPLSGTGITEDYLVGNIYYTAQAWSNGGAAAYYNGANGAYELRYVLIPGSVLATSEALKGLTKAQISTMSYDKLTSIVGPGATVQNN